MALNSSSPKSGGFWPHWGENKLFALLLAILMVYLIVLTLAHVQKTLREAKLVGVAERQPSTISVSATETASAVPDIATVDVGSTVIAPSAGSAQEQNTERMNKILEAMKVLGIEDKDLKTSSYDVYPQYDYSTGGPAKITGYQASQTLTVKIRESAKVSTVLDKAQELGATNIGSLRFEVDDNTSAEEEARKKAIEKAYAQALEIADAMGAHLGPVVSYSEYAGGGNPMPYMYDAVKLESAAGSAPAIAPGENETSMTVNINYVIR
jgi:uncharacterized protein YggE